MTKYIIIRESIFQSAVKDIISLGLLFLLEYLNVKYLDKSFFISLTVCICFFVYVVGFKSRKKSYTLQDAIDELQNKQMDKLGKPNLSSGKK